jgi:UDPglucose 6-dehydrogenase/GDP-mannose 6-dehydrogenase
LAEGAKISAYDPVAKEEAQKIFDNDSIHYGHTLSETVNGAAAILLITRWDEFHQVPDLIKDEDPQPVVVDGRRMLDKSKIAKYEGIGL